jgi:hypothetical protein
MRSNLPALIIQPSVSLQSNRRLTGNVSTLNEWETAQIRALLNVSLTIKIYEKSWGYWFFQRSLYVIRGTTDDRYSGREQGGIALP